MLPVHQISTVTPPWASIRLVRMANTDLMGQKFGLLTAVERTHLGAATAWICKCDCGNKRTVTSSDLKRTDSRGARSCGCHRKGPRIDLTGQKFGRLTALRSERLDDVVAWVCKCSCGQFKTLPTSSLRAGGTRSCGCLDHEAKTLRPNRLTHGDTRGKQRTREHRIWSGMIQRCTTENTKNYSSYGGRGIKICDRWLGESGYVRFLADMGRCPPGMSIDRYPNNDGDYEPTNCRWATPTEQARNTRATIIVDFRGRRIPLQEVAEITGVKFHTLYDRIKRHCVSSLKEAVHTDDRRAVYVQFRGKRVQLKDVAMATGIKYATLRARYHSGMPIEQAANPVLLRKYRSQ